MNSTTEPNSTQRFNGAKLKLARSFRGLTLTELGSRVAASPGYIHHLETGLKAPTTVMVQSLASVLSFSSKFFYSPLADELLEEECHFRSRRMPASLRTRVLSHGTLFLEFVDYLQRRVQLPSIGVPNINATGRDEVERAAEQCRQSLGLGLDRPITHMSRALERVGVVVTRFGGASMRTDALKVDAFSRPRAGARPIVVLNTDKGSRSRTRFDLAHELGHLVMHEGLPSGASDHEDDANSFASAFLLPRIGFVREFPVCSRLDWDLVFRLKTRWKASGAAIFRRAFDLGRIDALEYRRACKHYMYRRWHQAEPHEDSIPEEPPELIATALEVLKNSRGIAGVAVAEALGWSPETFEEVVGLPIERPLLPAISDPSLQLQNVIQLDQFRTGRTDPGPI